MRKYFGKEMPPKSINLHFYIIIVSKTSLLGNVCEIYITWKVLHSRRNTGTVYRTKKKKEPVLKPSLTTY